MQVTSIKRNKNGQFMKNCPSWNKGKKLSKNHRKKLSEAKKKNPVRYWSGKSRILGGNIIQRKDGYKYIAWSLIEKPVKKLFSKSWKGRTVPEHHYIWLKHNKRKIPKGYCIHHKNHVKNDNRVDNLSLMRMNDHSSLHHPKGIKIGV